jgi:hypothetical protein
MGGRKLQRKRVYEKVSILSPGPQQPPSKPKTGGGKDLPAKRRSIGHDDQLDFDDVDGDKDVFQGESMSLDLEDEEVEPDSAVGDDDDDDDDFGEDDDEASADRQYAREVAEVEANKRAFENAKRELLSQLPKPYIDRFGQVGFGKYSKKFYPVMILSPYDVPYGPPANIREGWMETFEKVRKLLKYRERTIAYDSKLRVSHVNSDFALCR